MSNSCIYVKDAESTNFALQQYISSLGYSLYIGRRMDLESQQKSLNILKRLEAYSTLLKVTLDLNYNCGVRFCPVTYEITMTKDNIPDTVITRTETPVKKVGDKIQIRVFDNWTSDIDTTRTSVSYIYRDIILKDYLGVNILKIMDNIKNEINYIGN